MKSKFYTVLITMFAILSSCLAQQNILECLDMTNRTHRFSFNESDSSPIDTLIDLKNGYYELSNEYQQLTQATKFGNLDKSSLLLISGFYSDMQCANFPFHIFEIDKTGDSCTKKEAINYFPDLKIEDFLKSDSVLKIAEKYLPLLTGGYLDENAKVSEVISEFYDLHFILPRYGTTVEVTLTVCDYIPTNEQEIVEWDIVEKSIRSLYFKFNKQTGMFELTAKK